MASPKPEQVLTVLGAQWGDEGKGKLVDILCSQFDVCARFNGGANAGHTVVVGDKKYALHLLPSGVIHPNSLCVIGNGVVLHIASLLSEIKNIEEQGVSVTPDHLVISDRATLVLDVHQLIDGANEVNLGDSKIGTTRRGIGPAYADKANRTAIRVGDLLHFDDGLPAKLRAIAQVARAAHGDLRHPDGTLYDVEEEIERHRQYAITLAPYIKDTLVLVNDAHAARKRILLEGANAGMLDLDFGTYPYVTSSHPTVGGAITGLGLSSKKINSVVGIVKAYTTRVGGGPFPTELLCDVGDRLRAAGHEFGTTTGRPRRCGWLDIVVIRHTHLFNGYTSLNLTKLDILTGLPELKIATAYLHNGKPLPGMPAQVQILSSVEVQYETLPGWTEDISRAKTFAELPPNCQAYVRRVEHLCGVPIKWIGVGAGREEMIELPISS